MFKLNFEEKQSTPIQLEQAQRESLSLNKAPHLRVRARLDCIRENTHSVVNTGHHCWP